MTDIQRYREGYIPHFVRQHACRTRRCFSRGCVRAYFNKHWTLPSKPTSVTRFIADMLGRILKSGASAPCKVFGPHIDLLRIIEPRTRTFRRKCVQVRVCKVRPFISLRAWCDNLVEDDSPRKNLPAVSIANAATKTKAVLPSFRVTRTCGAIFTPCRVRRRRICARWNEARPKRKRDEVFGSFPMVECE